MPRAQLVPHSVVGNKPLDLTATRAQAELGVLFQEHPELPDVYVVSRTKSAREAAPQRLTLDYCNLTECCVVKGEECLQLLSYQHNGIRTICNMDGLAQLTSLDLYSNQIETLSGLESLCHLRVLMLGRNRLSTLSNIQGLRLLEVLDVHGNLLEEVAGVTVLSSLKVLNLSGNALGRLPDLSPLASLTDLNLRRNFLNSLAAADAMGGSSAALRGVAMAPCCLPTSLTKLFLSHNRFEAFEDLQQLTQLTQLRELTLDGNPCCAELVSTDSRRQALVHCPGCLLMLDSQLLSPQEQEFLGCHHTDTPLPGGSAQGGGQEQQSNGGTGVATNSYPAGAIRLGHRRPVSATSTRAQPSHHNPTMQQQLPRSASLGNAGAAAHAGCAGLQQLPGSSPPPMLIRTYSHKAPTPGQSPAPLPPRLQSRPSTDDLEAALPAVRSQADVGLPAEHSISSLGSKSKGPVQVPAAQPVKESMGSAELLAGNRLLIQGPALWALRNPSSAQVAEVHIAHVSFYQVVAAIDALSALPRLRRLMLSDNGLTTLPQLDHLSSLTRLQELTLTDNPVAELVLLRTYVALKFPELRLLNGASITAEERQTGSKIFSPIRDAVDAAMQLPAQRAMLAGMSRSYGVLSKGLQALMSDPTAGGAAMHTAADRLMQSAGPGECKAHAESWVARQLAATAQAQSRLTDFEAAWDAVVSRCIAEGLVGEFVGTAR